MANTADIERATERVITSASDSPRIEINDADLRHLGLEPGDSVKVVTFSDKVQIRPTDDS